MGTNINIHIEVKMGGKWEHYTVVAYPHVERDGLLSAKVAGMGLRYYPDVVPLTHLGKWPKNATKPSLFGLEKSSKLARACHLSSDDFLKLDEFMRENSKDYSEKYDRCTCFGFYLFGDCFGEDYGIEDYRLLIYFD